MPTRDTSFGSANNYRYGFNGKEVDNEVKGKGNQQDYGMRIYDPRIGRFLSVDPLLQKYPELTPYQYASNRVIQGIDLDGLEFLDLNKYKKGSVWGLVIFKVDSHTYIVDNLYQKNMEVHKVIVNHPTNSHAFGKEGLEDIPSPIHDQTTQGPTIDHMNESAETANKVADGVSEGISLLKKVIIASYKFKHKEEMEYAKASISALNSADNLVRVAIGNPTFPKRLISFNSSVQTDLVNYLTDLTLPSTKDFGYKNIILTWGNLLFNHQTEILNGPFNFSPANTQITPQTKSGPSDLKINFGPLKQTSGNKNKDVQEANDLIKNKSPQRPITVVTSNSEG